MTDSELLQIYSCTKAPDAFAELVRRHAGWVCAMARRQAHDSHLAEDITQAVFLLLSQKAASLADHPHLSAWLFKTTRFCAASALRERNRRRHREEKLMMIAPQTTDDLPADWTQIQPHLDAAVASLRDDDRHAIVLRFYEGQSMAQIATKLQIGEEAAKKRVQRALDKLRLAFARSGITAGAGSLGVVLLNHLPTSTSPGLATMITTAISSGGSATSRSLLHSATKAVFLAKAKLAAGLLLAATIATSAVIAAGHPAIQPIATSPATAPAAETPLVLADLSGVKTLRITWDKDPSNSAPREVWLTREGSDYTSAQSAAGNILQREEGQWQWRYREGGSLIGKSPRRLSFGLFQTYLDMMKPLASSASRQSDRDKTVNGERLRCFKLAANPQNLTQIRVDDASRIRTMANAEVIANISYDQPLPAEFSRPLPANMPVVDADTYLDEQYPLDKAIFTKEIGGLVLAVHECRVDAQGICQLIYSTRPSKATIDKAHLTRRDQGTIILEAVDSTNDKELVGHIPKSIATLTSANEWTKVYWCVLVPDPRTPDRHDHLNIAGRVLVINEVQGLLLRGEEAIIPFAIDLRSQGPATSTVADFARRACLEANRLWPAIDASMAIPKTGQSGGVVWNSSDPPTDADHFGPLFQDSITRLVRRLERDPK